MNIMQITLRGETLYQHAHQILIHLLREAQYQACTTSRRPTVRLPPGVARNHICFTLLREAHLNTYVEPSACLILFISYCVRLISNMYGFF